MFHGTPPSDLDLSGFKNLTGLGLGLVATVLNQVARRESVPSAAQRGVPMTWRENSSIIIG